MSTAGCTNVSESFSVCREKRFELFPCTSLQVQWLAFENKTKHPMKTQPDHLKLVVWTVKALNLSCWACTLACAILCIQDNLPVPNICEHLSKSENPSPIIQSPTTRFRITTSVFTYQDRRSFEWRHFRKTTACRNCTRFRFVSGCCSAHRI